MRNDGIGDMLDINYIRENIDSIKKAVKDKRIDLDVDLLMKIDQKRRDLIVKVDTLRQQRNQAAKEKDIENGKKVKEELDILEESLKSEQQKFNELMVKVPTVPANDTPVGESDKDNVEIYKWGEHPVFNFDPKDHIELGKKLKILDLEKGAKVGGYRGYYLKNEGAILVMAIMMYAVETLRKSGYEFMIPPTLVKDFALFGTGYFKGTSYNPEVDEIYKVATKDKDSTGEESSNQKFLVGTAEPSLLAYYSGDILKEEDLPIRVCGYSQCYRSEIGSYGKDTKGLYRVHEFMKVEQVILCKADIEESDKLQEEMIGISKQLHEELGLPYRQLRISTGDLSAGKYKQFDIEAWMPGLDRYGETGSGSNFLDWQARRLDVKYETKTKEKKYVFMLNNTALPSPRVFIAILENYQQVDGSVKIPEVLQKYTGFTEIKPKN